MFKEEWLPNEIAALDKSIFWYLRALENSIVIRTEKEQQSMREILGKAKTVRELLPSIRALLSLIAA